MFTETTEAAHDWLVARDARTKQYMTAFFYGVTFILVGLFYMASGTILLWEIGICGLTTGLLLVIFGAMMVIDKEFTSFTD